LGRTDAEAKRTAQGLVDHFNWVLNRTVSESRLVAVYEEGSSPPHFVVARLEKRAIASIELHGTSLMLLVQHKFAVEDGHCRTLTYSYNLHRPSDRKAWLCRWEYFRQPPKEGYPYPLGHVHVNAALIDTGEDVSDKHIPTDRVPLEEVLLHLIEEWGVKSLSRDYRAILEGSIDGFAERRTDR
jgi:hypothetical protein